MTEQPMTSEERAAWDRFAAAALGAHYANTDRFDAASDAASFPCGENVDVMAARWAADAADALLAERRKRMGGDA